MCVFKVNYHQMPYFPHLYLARQKHHTAEIYTFLDNNPHVGNIYILHMETKQNLLFIYVF